MRFFQRYEPAYYSVFSNYGELIKSNIEKIEKQIEELLVLGVNLYSEFEIEKQLRILNETIKSFDEDIEIINSEKIRVKLDVDIINQCFAKIKDDKNWKDEELTIVKSSLDTFDITIDPISLEGTYALRFVGKKFNFEAVEKLCNSIGDIYTNYIFSIHNISNLEELKSRNNLVKEDVLLRLSNSSYLIKKGLYFKKDYEGLASILLGYPYAPIKGTIKKYYFNTLYGYTGIEIGNEIKSFLFWFKGDFRTKLCYNINDEIEKGYPLTNLIEFEMVGV